MTVPNPLAAVPSGGRPTRWSGIWIAEDIEQIAAGVAAGSWIDTALGTLGAGLDALALVSDPLGALLQYGISWLIGHVKPLSDALDLARRRPGADRGTGPDLARCRRRPEG